ncbi:MAG: hypothetical protein GF405_05075 [Candidatus Eisenbacteria bacterium]|nr:hypothetical protein [Candidatus Eisenbacteria bacterium]
MAGKVVQINRAPVLTLWAAVVAEHLGYDRDEALTFGRAVAGLNAQSKGRRLGIFKPSREKGKTPEEQRPGEVFRVEVLGRAVPAVETDDGIRAVKKDKEIDPEKVRDYLERKFGEDLDDVRRAMDDLASSLDGEELAERAYALYESFRPDIPSGRKGWGAKGDLDLGLIRSLE